MKVTATEKGFFDGKLRYEGDVFDYEGDKPASWMKPSEQKPKPEPKKKA